LKKDKALVGRSLVQASKNIFVRVMNPSADTQIIYPGTIVAQVSPVQEVVNPNSKIDEEGELRTDLINLLERSQEHLRLPSTSNILFCKSIKPAFDLKQSKPIIPSTVICATNACTTISFVSSSLIRKLPRPKHMKQIC
jgi:RAB protein geranylgeranyltransferase component A